MKLSDIKLILTNKQPIAYLLNIISTEVNDYNIAVKRKKSVVDIYLINDVTLEFGKDELQVLCKAFLEGKVSDAELSYISDALLLSGNVEFESENIRQYVEQLTDPEINGKINNETVMAILKQIV